MRVLVIKHVESEGPGTLGSYLESIGAEVETVGLHAGQRLPSDADRHVAIVCMGGPMNVYEEDRYPFLREETEFLACAIARDVPVLGICLGAQLIAKAAGARVTRSPQEEIGWSHVQLTPEGQLDPLFRGMPASLPVLQWHGDMFEVPSRGALLAGGAACPNQALRVRNAYGLQFHVEVTREILEEWFRESPHLEAILAEYDGRRADLDSLTRTMYDNFMRIAWATLTHRLPFTA